MKLLMVYPQSYDWEETGRWIHEAFLRLGHEVEVFDDVRTFEVLDSITAMNHALLKKYKEYNPDAVFMLKCEKVTPLVLHDIKALKILWHPDVRKKVQKWVVNKAKGCDKFYTMSPGSLPEYKSSGVEHAEYLPEACDPAYHFHAPWVSDYFKSDVNFVGTVRNSRIDMCERIINDTYNFKAWGGTDYGAGDRRVSIREIELIRKCHMNRHVWREFHSYVASHGISVTWDWCPEVERSYSARIYRVMGSRGLYLCKYVEGMEKVFKQGEHCDWYHNLDEMSEKINYWLENKRLRERVGLAAQKLVYAEHTFDNRVKVIDEWIKTNLR